MRSTLMILPEERPGPGCVSQNRQKAKQPDAHERKDKVRTNSVKAKSSLGPTAIALPF